MESKYGEVAEYTLIQDLEMLHLRAARFVKRINKRVSDSDVLSKMA